jgi:hypothetical protein
MAAPARQSAGSRNCRPARRSRSSARRRGGDRIRRTQGLGLKLLGHGATLTRATLRDFLGVKNERLGDVWEALWRTGRLVRRPGGWQRLGRPLTGAGSRSPKRERERNTRPEYGAALSPHVVRQAYDGRNNGREQDLRHPESGAIT